MARSRLSRHVRRSGSGHPGSSRLSFTNKNAGMRLLLHEAPDVLCWQSKKVEMRKDMKSCRFVLGVFLACGVMSAQETYTPKFEAGLNYSWLHVKSANYDYQRTGNGGSGYIEYNLNHIVRLCETSAAFLRVPRKWYPQSQLNELAEKPSIA